VDDPRFTTSWATLKELLDQTQLDTVDELETFMMFLFRRPIGIKFLQNAEDDAGALDVTVPGDDCILGRELEFPFSLGELVMSCIDDLEDTGPYTNDGDDAPSSRDVASLTDIELEAAMGEALGETGIFVMLDQPNSEA
jgi:hypothetical protein